MVIWVFFRFKSNNQPIVYENKVEKEVEAVVEKAIDSGDSQREEVGHLEIEKEELTKVESEIKKEQAVNFSAEDKETEEKSENDIKIKDNLVSWGFSSSKNRNIDTIILHSSYNVLGGDEYDLDKIILEYKQYGVAPHYVIDREGEIFRLVKDANIAYHAGESKVPDGRTGVNNFSIGIEVVNSEKDNFTSKQYTAINELIAFLKDKYKIKYVLGHDQIAPGRKTDPWNINWEKVNK
ncbi:MAG: N-acetylmuramyl-L-alanine amidase, negative regulator of AmpC, AmpD [Candidatus Moranbacteria bacterium GW2011_GWF1_34_10]|nr:MAG: N-acetylmuramyl-L-alanine amidase, negative regulator of AmpC, AmpD [Candidatus Moranbacteria bacterium GW2011_GWF1_34_10]